MQLNGLSLAITNVLGGRLNPLSWFAAGEQGAWYDPSDLTTLFQDSAGTIPVTAVEQPVGLMKDKSGKSNHAFQATAGNRPTLSARVNTLLATDGFSGGILTPTNGLTLTGSGLLDPRGGFTAKKYTNSTNSTQQRLYSGATGTGSLTYSVEVLYVDARFIQLDLAGTSTGTSAVTFDLVNKTYSLVYTVAAPTATITPLANGYLRLSVIGYPETTAIQNIQLYVLEADPGAVTPTTTGTNKSVIVAGADLRPTNSGALLPPYQRVNTASDYDTVGFPLYLKANGTSSAMSTNSIDFTATDKMTVVTGVRKLSDVTGVILEESPVTDGSHGGFIIHTTVSPANGYTTGCSSSNSGVQFSGCTVTTFIAPVNNVVSVLYDLSKTLVADVVIPKVNGSTPTKSTVGTTPVIGTFNNYPFYLFARAGTSLWFNGQFYGAIIRGAQSDTASLTQTENYMATKTGITF